MGVHAVAFAGVGLLGHADSAITPTTLTLFGSTSHPLAIVLHPFGSREPAGFALILITLWSLGRSIERQCGTARLLGMYGLANLIAGTVYYGFAQTVPELSTRPLDLPVGGLAALAFAAWRTLIKTPFRFFRHTFFLGRAAAGGAGIVAVWVFFWGAEGATAWLLAAAAGGLAWPLTRGVARSR